MHAPRHGLRTTLALLGLGATLSCTGPHKLISARRISCPPKKIEIRDLVSSGYGEEWIAVCGERSYECSTREVRQRLVYSCRALPRVSDAGVGAGVDSGVDASPVAELDSGLAAASADSAP